VDVEVTPRLVTVKVPVVAPAAIVIVAGTVATAGVPEVKLTVRPPTGAGLLIVTVPVEVDPPGTDVGLSERPETVGAVIVKLPVCDVELAVAVIVTGVLAATANVVIAAVPVVAPAAIVIVPGTVADAVLEVSVIVSPPGGAALEIVTVAELPAAPTTVELRMLMPVTVGPVTINAPVIVVVPTVAPMLAVTVDWIPDVVAVNVAVLAPAAMLTDPGTWAAAVLLEVSVTVTPPLGAAPDRVTVPVEDAPPRTVPGDMTTDRGTGGIIGSSHFSDTPQAVAVKLVVTLLVTGVAVMAKVPDVAPDGTVTVAGTVTYWGRSTLIATENPAGGAAALKFSVPVIVPPP